MLAPFWFYRFRRAFCLRPVKRWKFYIRCILVLVGLGIFYFCIKPTTPRSGQDHPNNRLPALWKGQFQTSDNAELLSRISSWTPSKASLDKLLYYLNLTESDVPSHLPVTLRGPELLSNSTLCVTEDGRPVDVLFVVHSAPDHLASRVQMRRTFMAQRYFPPFKIRSVFLLGRGDSRQQIALQQEQNQFGDLVQGDFVDHYSNLSHKGVMGFRWVAQHCARARFVVKLDDDAFFDTFKLLRRHWVFIEARKRSMFCYFRKEPEILRESKWGVEKRFFRNLSTFPYPYCTGLAVIITGDLIPSLYVAARFTPVFWIDDYYLFGILPHMASDVTFYSIGYDMQPDWEPALKCIRDRKRNCRLLVVHLERHEQTSLIREVLWNETMKLREDEQWSVAETKHV